MKKYLLSFILILLSASVMAQEFEVETIARTGDDDKRINLVFLSDGYQEHELNKFKTDVRLILLELFLTTPFKEYKNYFNVHIIKVPSNVSGASRDPNNLIDNYFGSTYFFAGIERLLVPTLDNKVASVLADNFPEYDQAFVLVNDDKYGGSGGWLATSSTNVQAGQIMIHEIGHSMADLSDEYWAGPQFAGESPNMTQITNPTTVKWKNWYGDNEIGIYPHSEDPRWHKPHQSCKMELLGLPFCAVCRETFVHTFYDMVPMIQSSRPGNDDALNNSQNFSVIAQSPTPYSLRNFWMLDTDTISRNESLVILDLADLSDGQHDLKMNIADHTELSRKDNIPMDIVTWSINKSGSSISFTTELNRQTVNRLDFLGKSPQIVTGTDDDFITEIRLKAFPNPVSDQLKVTFFNPRPAPFQMKLIGLNGQTFQVEDREILNQGEQEFVIDTSGLRQGIFLVQLQIGDKLVIQKLLK
ncbi:MAG: hypothetical protein Roseis2KO_23860 [Roseivirga sp.]